MQRQESNASTRFLEAKDDKQFRLIVLNGSEEFLHSTGFILSIPYPEAELADKCCQLRNELCYNLVGPLERQVEVA